MRRARARTGDSATTRACEDPAATLTAWEWRWRRRPACSCGPPLRSARHEPAHQALAHDGAEDLLLVLEVAVERPRGDPGVAGDLRDAGAAVAEGGEALLGGCQDAGPGGGVARLGRSLHGMNI